MSDSLAKQVSRLPLEEQEAWLDGLDVDLKAELARNPWWFIGRPEQLLPEGNWRIWLIMAGRGFGKALDCDTPIPTPTGWTTMGELRAGDEVFSADGSVTRVTWTTGQQFNRPCFRVRFHDGTEVVADADHQWSARNKMDRRGKRPYRVVTTTDIASSVLRGKERNWQMPCAEALELPEKNLPIDPYVLGLWLGDGSSASADITIGKQDYEELSQLLAKHGEPITGKPRVRNGNRTSTVGGVAQVRNPKTGRMESNGSLHTRLRELGVMKNKHIPTLYLRASKGQREKLLAGLIDSDGYVCQSTGLIEITTVKNHFAVQIKELVNSLGHRANICEGRATINGRDVGAKYRVSWVARDGGGRLKRKTLTSRHHLAQSERIKSRYVASVEPVESRPVCCIGVEHPSEMYLCGRDFLATHNSRSGAENLVQLVLETPSQDGAPTEWLVIADTFSDCRKICVEGPSGILRVLRSYAMVENVHFTYNRSLWQIVLSTGQIIHMSGADSKDTGRGLNLSGLWADEIAKWRYATETWTEAVYPALRIGKSPKAIITTTPKPGHELLKRWLNRTDGSVIVTKGSIDDNRDNLSQAQLDEMHALYDGTRLGRQELEGEYLEDTPGALWRWEMLRIGEPLERKRTVVAVDPAVTNTADSDETGIVVCTKDNAGMFYVLADLSMKGSVRDWAARVNEAYERFSADLVVYEDNQGGDAIAEVLKQQNPYIPLRAVRATVGKRLRAEPIAMLYERGLVFHAEHFEKLEAQMLTWEADSPKSPDRLDALVHALTALSGTSGASRFLSELADVCPSCGQPNVKGVELCNFCHQPMTK